MEDTCRKEACWLYKLMKELLGEKEVLDIKACPFYIEMIFTPISVNNEAGKPKVVEDCAAKRSLLHQLEFLHPRITGVQEALEKQGNKNDSLLRAMVAMTNVLAASTGARIDMREGGNGVEGTSSGDSSLPERRLEESESPEGRV